MQIEISQLELRYASLRISETARQARLTASILQEGQLSPVLVVAEGPTRFVLIDGYARVEALLGLSHDLVEALVLAVSECEALMLGLRFETARRRSALEEGWLLQTLVEEHGMSQPELSVQLTRSRSWVSRRLALVRVLPASVQEAVKRGVLPPHAAEKYLVPLARANSTHCKKLVENLNGQRISVRQMARLYIGWRCGDAEQKESIVENPRLYLKATEVDIEKPLPRLDKPPLLDELESVVRFCYRARRRLREGGGEMASGAWLMSVTCAWREARLAFSALENQMEQENPNAGHGYPHGDSTSSQGGTRSPEDCQCTGGVEELRQAYPT